MFAVFIWIIFSIIVCIVAYSKGRSWAGWFFLSILISPLISLIILLCVGDSDDKKEESLRKAMNVIERANIKEDNETMNQDKAIEELQKAKKLLDLEVITQEEYDVKKAELMPFLRNDFPSSDIEEVAEEQTLPVEEESQDLQEDVDNSIEQKDERWYQKTWVQTLMATLVSLLVVCLIGFFIRLQNSSKSKNKTNNHAKTEINTNVAYENYQDNSLEHQIYARDKFIENLAITQKYLITHGTLKDYTCSFNPKSMQYDVCVCYDVTRMKKLCSEIYKGNVFISVDGKTITCSIPCQTNFMVDNNDGVIGRWIISVPSTQHAHELIIKKEGVNYYSYEYGKKKKLSRKENCYYKVNNEAGEYFKILGNNLRLCDKQGDYTSLYGYSIKTIYTVRQDTPTSVNNDQPSNKQPINNITQIKKELQSLYRELLDFKNKADFILYGFDPDGPYYNWLKRAEAFDNKTNQEILSTYGIAPGEIKMLGLQYVHTRGLEDDYTRFMKGEINAAINKMK